MPCPGNFTYRKETQYQLYRRLVGAAVLLHNVGFCDFGVAVYLQQSLQHVIFHSPPILSPPSNHMVPYGLLLFSGMNYLVPFEFPLSEKLLATLGTLEWLHTQMLLLVIGEIFLVPANIV